ncbi:MAG: ABC transporter permease [Pirellulales bacterium]
MAETSETARSPRSGRTRSQALLTTLGPVLVFFVVLIGFGIADRIQDGANSTFLSVNTIRTIPEQTVIVAMAALGMTIIIIAGGIDLASGTAVALCSTTLAWCLKNNYGIGVGVSAALGMGALTGLINGALISSLRIVPFIVTLGTMSIFLGVAKLIGNETTVSPSIDQYPRWLSTIAYSPVSPKWLIPSIVPNFAISVWIVLGVAVLTAAMLKYTVFGRYVFAVGSSEPTARLCGINVTAVRIAVYTLAGLCVGMAGVLQFTRLRSGDPTSGSGLELKIIAAAVIGGASLNGGRGSILGTLAGAAMMVVIESGCNALGISNSYTNIVIGAIIIAAAALDQIRQRRLAG